MAYRGRVPNPRDARPMLQQGRLARGLSHRELAAELELTQHGVSEMGPDVSVVPSTPPRARRPDRRGPAGCRC